MCYFSFLYMLKLQKCFCVIISKLLCIIYEYACLPLPLHTLHVDQKTSKPYSFALTWGGEGGPEHHLWYSHCAELLKGAVHRSAGRSSGKGSGGLGLTVLKFCIHYLWQLRWITFHCCQLILTPPKYIVGWWMILFSLYKIS